MIQFSLSKTDHDYGDSIAPPYDTREGLINYLKEGLKGLNYLIQDRSRAGYTNGERMKDWIILGRWWADSCGNFGKIKVD